MKRCRLPFFAALIMSCAPGSYAAGQTVLDPGFESYSVAPGQWTNVGGGPWQFNNNAGVVEPFAPPTALNPQMTWAATIAPYEGLQYGSAYAGADFFDTTVVFPAAGSYVLSVFAASPSNATNASGAVPPLTTGDFRFALGGAVTGPTFVPPLDTGWNKYSTTVQVNSPGPRLVGVHTSKVDSYFIYFDAFAVVPVPEPTNMGLALITGIACLRRRKSCAWAHSAVIRQEKSR